MKSTIAFAGLQLTDKTMEYIPGAPDTTHRVSGNDIYMGRDNLVYGVYICANTIEKAQLLSPSLRATLNPYIAPQYDNASPGLNQDPILWRGDNPMPLVTNEALNVKCQVSTHSETIYSVCGVFLCDTAIRPVGGTYYTNRQENLVPASVAGRWSANTMDLDEDLPVGRYQIIGAQVYADKPGLFRLVPIDSADRPGGIIYAGNVRQSTLAQRGGQLGVWCEFNQLTPPSIEILGNEAISWYQLHVDLVKVA